VVKKKSKNGGFGRKIVNNINWLSVFAPIIVSFAIVLVIK